MFKHLKAIWKNLTDKRREIPIKDEPYKVNSMFRVTYLGIAAVRAGHVEIVNQPRPGLDVCEPDSSDTEYGYAFVIDFTERVKTGFWSKPWTFNHAIYTNGDKCWTILPEWFKARQHYCSMKDLRTGSSGQFNFIKPQRNFFIPKNIMEECNKIAVSSFETHSNPSYDVYMNMKRNHGFIVSAQGVIDTIDINVFDRLAYGMSK